MRKAFFYLHPQVVEATSRLGVNQALSEKHKYYYPNLGILDWLSVLCEGNHSDDIMAK